MKTHYRPRILIIFANFRENQLAGALQLQFVKHRQNSLTSPAWAWHHLYLYDS